MVNSKHAHTLLARNRLVAGARWLGELGQALKRITDHPLNQHRKVRAVGRFVSWQIGSRLVGGPVVVPWVNNTRFMVRRGDSGITGNLYCGLLEYDEMSFILHATQPDDLFVDVGANVGSHVLLACGAAGARGLALEPVPGTYAKLVDNLHLNNLGSRVRAINAGAADVRTSLRFTSNLDSVNHVLSEAEVSRLVSAVEVPVYPIDELLEGARSDILKIDVEGYEYQVLQGARHALRNAKALVIELNGSGNRYGHSDEEIVAELHALGFTSCRYHPGARHLEAIQWDAMSHSPNAIFVRDVDAVRAVIARSPCYRVNDIEV